MHCAGLPGCALPRPSAGKHGRLDLIARSSGHDDDGAQARAGEATDGLLHQRPAGDRVGEQRLGRAEPASRTRGEDQSGNAPRGGHFLTERRIIRVRIQRVNQLGWRLVKSPNRPTSAVAIGIVAAIAMVAAGWPVLASLLR